MKLEVMPHQKLMIDFLLGHDRAALFAGCGLAKTASTLSALNELFADGACKAALVIAPLRVARLTWPNEVKKWDNFRWMRVESLHSGKPPSGKAQLYTINYESLHKLKDLSFCDTVIFDELTRAKNPSSLRIKALRPLLGNHRRWGLTGTPRPNSLLELFAQIRLLDDGKALGPSFAAFRSTWCEPTDYMEYNWEPKPHAEEKVYQKIHDLVLTLRSSDYLDIAETVFEDIEVKLPEAAQKVYAQLERDLLALIDSEEVVAVNAAVLVNKLLQVTGGTVYSEERNILPLHSGKIQALKKIIRENPEENFLVATNYVHERERVVASIPGAIDAAKFEGDIEQEWNAGKIPVLVADPRSLGHGLNLQAGGKSIVWFSPTWSRELYDQFNARIARKGQREVPVVYRLICPGTIDDAVIESLRVKGDGQSAMLAVLTNFRQQGLTFKHAA